MIKAKPHILRRTRMPAEGLFCNYSHRVCMQNRLENFEFCIKHILEDKNSPYKQCNYVSNKTGKRCPNAAPKADKRDGYCVEHARKTLLLRQRAHRKRRPLESPDTLLGELDHYGRHTPTNEHPDIKRTRPSLDNSASKILDYASSSDSEAEATTVDQAWRGDGDSEAESIDSEQEDSLKHAGVYTQEEVALITRDKLIRLQSLYIDQFKRLQHVMKEKRRKYIQSSQMERETLGSIRAAKDDPDQREPYEKLVAMKRYHKRYGKEALLHRQSKERRIAASERENYKPPSYPRCTFTEGKGPKCGARTVPLAKFCSDHILNDPVQTLYQPCMFGEGLCLRPVVDITTAPRCLYHTLLQNTGHRYPQSNIEDESQLEDSKDSTHIDVEGTDIEVKLEEEDGTANLTVGDVKEEPLDTPEVDECHETVPNPLQNGGDPKTAEDEAKPSGCAPV